MKQIKVKCPAKTTSALDEQGESLEMRRPALDAGSHEFRVLCPAKINLTLEILNKREDGFHNIQSVMQTIDLFDILTISVKESENFEIKLSGTSDEIPYDEKNLVYKAAKLFFAKSKMQSGKCSIFIEKNIPIAAGLAGGSTDAAGTLWGLNEIFERPLSKKELHELCAQLGSDLNFCLEGGCQLTTGRGEILEPLNFCEFNLSLIKPKDLGISAKEAYTKFSQLDKKPNLDMTTKLVEALKSGNCKIEDYLHNDLEYAVINDYEQLQQIKNTYPASIMSGSGSTFFTLEENTTSDSDVMLNLFQHRIVERTCERPCDPESSSGRRKDFDDNFWIKQNLKSIPSGVCKEI